MTDSFDHLLDQCLMDVLSGRATVDGCLARHPAQAAQLEPVLRAAARLHAVPPLAGLTPARRQALENRVMARLSPRKNYRPAQQPGTTGLSFWQRRLTWAAASVMAVVALTATTVGASAGSLPGDLLYPVKQATEQVTLALTPSDARPAVHAELAQRRLQEFAALMDRGEVMPDLLHDASNQLNLALDENNTLTPDQQATVLKAVEQLDTPQIDAVNTALDQALEAVNAARSKAPLNASDGLDNALSRITAAQERLQELRQQIPPSLGNGSNGKPPEQPGAGKGQPPSGPPGQVNPPGQGNGPSSGGGQGQQGQGQGQGQQNDKGKGNK